MHTDNLFEWLGIVWWTRVQRRLRESDGDVGAVARNLKKQGVPFIVAWTLIFGRGETQ